MSDEHDNVIGMSDEHDTNLCKTYNLIDSVISCISYMYLKVVPTVRYIELIQNITQPYVLCIFLILTHDFICFENVISYFIVSL